MGGGMDGYVGTYLGRWVVHGSIQGQDVDLFTYINNWKWGKHGHGLQICDGRWQVQVYGQICNEKFGLYLQ